MNPKWQAIANAVGPRIGTAATREAFAKEVMAVLPGAVVKASWAQKKPAVQSAASDARLSLLELESWLSGAGLFALTRSRTFKSKITAALKFIDLLEADLGQVARRRGPAIEGQLVIVEMLARLYVKHFNQPPAYSGQLGRAPTPFDRVCTEIDKLLISSGHSNTIGVIGLTARKSAIAYARKLIEDNGHNTEVLETLKNRDPCQTLPLGRLRSPELAENP